ncbi:helix-turn-helix domain-containing protein [Novosphingobium panipatense]|nr:MarR family transcriptional regulator [Novosphingobium panipatense]
MEGARQILRARRKIAALEPRSLFRDTAWDMMLELFISGEEGGILFVKQLMIASGESAASAMRRIDRLESAGFLERIPDMLDQRRVIVQLTSKGRTAMLAMLDEVFGAPPAAPATPRPFVPRAAAADEPLAPQR